MEALKKLHHLNLDAILQCPQVRVLFQNSFCFFQNESSRNPSSHLILRIDYDGHRAVIDQADFHIRTKFSRTDRFSQF